MAEEPNPLPPTADPLNGFDPTTKIFHTLRPTVPLPPLQPPLSATDYILSLLLPTPDTPFPRSPAFIDSATGSHISYPDFFRQVRSLSSSLQSRFSLSKGHVAFILSPSSFHVPVLYSSLLSIGVILSPANPLGTPSEISRQIDLSRPNIVFTTSSYAHKLPSFLTLVLLDSQEFRTMTHESPSRFHRPGPVIHQLDPAAIFYSSGTTGNVKGVLLTHRNIIAVMAGVHTLQTKIDSPAAAEVSLITVPLFHIFGFFMVLNSPAGGETVVLMERFDFSGMLKAVEKYKVTYMPVSPPLVVAMAKSPEIPKYDLSSLTGILCAGGPLGKDVAERFVKRFPGVEIIQGYGLTESSGGATSTIGSDENLHYGSAGRLAENTQAKIVDPDTGEALPPGKQGELWLRGPSIMKGYVGDDKATAATLDKEGWLKTGDLCYFDKEGFLYIVDRLKELIKYKAYQVPPAEIEALLQSHKEIVDAAVIPYPDEEAGQIPMAYVVRQPGSSLNASHVMEFVAKQVAPYKKIRRVEFISAIPKSAAGKILRRELVKHSLSSSSSKL